MRLLLVAAAALAFACAHAPSPPLEAPVDELGGSADSERLLQDEAEMAASSSQAGTSVAAEAPESTQPTVRCRAMTDDGQIHQSAVTEVVEAGLGRWLQGVRVERVLEKNKFQGWKVQVLHLANPCYAAVDIRPGDVVTSINGSGPKKLERPESAQAVFNSLKQAKSIEVQYLRDGKPGTLTYNIAPEKRR